jgi:hypothetical protein
MEAKSVRFVTKATNRNARRGDPPILAPSCKGDNPPQFGYPLFSNRSVVQILFWMVSKAKHLIFGVFF